MLNLKGSKEVFLLGDTDKYSIFSEGLNILLPSKKHEVWGILLFLSFKSNSQLIDFSAYSSNQGSVQRVLGDGLSANPTNRHIRRAEAHATQERFPKFINKHSRWEGKVGADRTEKWRQAEEWQGVQWESKTQAEWTVIALLQRLGASVQGEHLRGDASAQVMDWKDMAPPELRLLEKYYRDDCYDKVRMKTWQSKAVSYSKCPSEFISASELHVDLWNDAWFWESWCWIFGCFCFLFKVFM